MATKTYRIRLCVVYKKATTAETLSMIHVAENHADDHENTLEPTKQVKQTFCKRCIISQRSNRKAQNIREDVTFYTQPGMKQEVEEYIRQCQTCQMNKITQNKTKLQMKTIITPDVLWEKCAPDIVGPLLQTFEENKYL